MNSVITAQSRLQDEVLRTLSAAHLIVAIIYLVCYFFNPVPVSLQTLGVAAAATMTEKVFFLVICHYLGLQFPGAPTHDFFLTRSDLVWSGLLLVLLGSDV